MTVRSPILAYIVWFLYMFSPFLILLLIAAIGGSNELILAVAPIPTFLSIYLYLAIVRHTRQEYLQQRIRMAALEEGRSFLLISRSFEQSKRFVHYGLLDRIYQTPMSLLEALIFDISRSFPVVVLGTKDLHPDDPAGRALYMQEWPAARAMEKSIFMNHAPGELAIEKPSDWLDIFSELASSAQRVLLIPANSEGVVREISSLKQKKLGEKTIIYMWPDTGAHPNPAICAPASDWDGVRDALATHGLSLPRRELMEKVIAEKGVGDPLKDAAIKIRNYELMSNPERNAYLWRCKISG